jgi:hypothetical protein
MDMEGVVRELAVVEGVVADGNETEALRAGRGCKQRLLDDMTALLSCQEHTVASAILEDRVVWRTAPALHQYPLKNAIRSTDANNDEIGGNRTCSVDSLRASSSGRLPIDCIEFLRELIPL